MTDTTRNNENSSTAPETNDQGTVSANKTKNQDELPVVTVSNSPKHASSNNVEPNKEAGPVVTGNETRSNED